jgi:hypothetical protein
MTQLVMSNESTALLPGRTRYRYGVAVRASAAAIAFALAMAACGGAVQNGGEVPSDAGSGFETTPAPDATTTPAENATFDSGTASDVGPAHDETTSKDAQGSIGEASTGVCRSKTCNELGYNCGLNDDQCAGLVDCGRCAPPDFCGGGGRSKCGHGGGSNDAGSSNDGGTVRDGSVPCTGCCPLTCAQLGANCGLVGDGCGGVLQCGTCVAPDYCGGGGFAICGSGSNTPDAAE